VFHHKRKWRFDLCWMFLRTKQSFPVVGIPGVAQINREIDGPKLAVEIDGGNFTKRPCSVCKVPIVQGGRHNSGPGYRDDLEKLAEAAILGWYVIRCLPEQIRSGETLTLIERFMFAHAVVLPKSPTPRRNPHVTT
jgi:hypothetical protein